MFLYIRLILLDRIIIVCTPLHCSVTLYFIFFLFSAYVFVSMSVIVCMGQLEDNSWELVLFYSLMESGDLRQVIRLANKHFSPLSHLTRPKSFVLKKTLCFVLNGSTHLPHLQNLDTHKQEDDLAHLWSHCDWWSHRHPGRTQVTSLTYGGRAAWERWPWSTESFITTDAVLNMNHGYKVN